MFLQSFCKYVGKEFFSGLFSLMTSQLEQVFYIYFDDFGTITQPPMSLLCLYWSQQNHLNFHLNFCGYHVFFPTQVNLVIIAKLGACLGYFFQLTTKMNELMWFCQSKYAL